MTINGEPAVAETDETTGAFDELVKKIEDQYSIQVDTTEATEAVDDLKGKLGEIPNTVTVTVRTNTISSSIAGITDSVSSTVNRLLGGYTGITGKMDSMASGGRSRGGKTLVGELGRELWISRDGKRQKIVGAKGMEVIQMRRGDAIVPNDMTEALIRGGISSAYGGSWGGSDSSNPLYNLQYATDGKYYNWKGSTSSSSKKKSSSSSSSSSTDALEDKLKELKEAFDEILNTFEHSIFVLEKNRGPVSQIVEIYR